MVLLTIPYNKLPDLEPYSYGVSVNMDLSYLKAAKLGEEILIEANVLKQGRTLAFLEVELRKRSTNELLVKGSHTICRVPGRFSAAP